MISEIDPVSRESSEIWSIVSRWFPGILSGDMIAARPIPALDVRLLYQADGFKLSEREYSWVFEAAGEGYGVHGAYVVSIDMPDDERAQQWWIGAGDWRDYDREVPDFPESAIIGEGWAVRMIEADAALVVGNSVFLDAFERASGETWEARETAFVASTVGFYAKSGAPAPLWLRDLLNLLHSATEVDGILAAAGFAAD